MRRLGIVLTVTLFLPSCVRVEYREYRGVQTWPTGSAFVGRIKGVEVYEGLPQRPYEVIGLVDVYSEDPFESGPATDKVLDLIDVKDAHALIWLSDRMVTSGSLRMGRSGAKAALIESGRSGRSGQTAQSEQPRSTLLLIQWKTN